MKIAALKGTPLGNFKEAPAAYVMNGMLERRGLAVSGKRLGLKYFLEKM